MFIDKKDPTRESIYMEGNNETYSGKIFTLEKK